MFKSLSKKQLIIGSALIGIIALAIGGGFYWQFSHHPDRPLPVASPQTNEDENTSIIRQIKQLVDIPTEETPTIATVTDSAKVNSQPFFASSQDGDRVLVFAEAKKVILFRPSTGKIINISTISPEGSASGALEASASSQEAALTIVIRNGTSTAGLAAKFESQIKAVIPTSQTKKENAAATDYKTSLIVVLNEQKHSQAQLLAEKLKMAIAALPEKEKAPTDTDIVVILGQDKPE